MCTKQAQHRFIILLALSFMQFGFLFRRGEKRRGSSIFRLSLDGVHVSGDGLRIVELVVVPVDCAPVEVVVVVVGSEGADVEHVLAGPGVVLVPVVLGDAELAGVVVDELLIIKGCTMIAKTKRICISLPFLAELPSAV